MSEAEFQQDFTVQLKMGLHIRPLAILSETANRFQCQIWITFQDEKLDAKLSPMDLMILGVECGRTVTIDTTGSDAESAMQAIADLFAENFGIDEDEEVTY